MPRLAQKTALITGAARGIGAGIADAFISEGARVLLTDIDDDAGAATAEALGGMATYRHLDVREESDWAGATRSLVSDHGRLDIVVNNAGITGFDPSTPRPFDPEHGSLDDWRAVFATNADGVFLGCQAAIRAMRPLGGGSIINLSSRSGLVGIPRAVAYAASKAAVRHHTKSVALYCAEEGLTIRCNAILPAAIDTPMWDAMVGTGPDRKTNMQAFVTDCPLRRFGTVDEVASLAVYLASDESTYTTGADFTIDGGMLAGAANPPRPQDG